MSTDPGELTRKVTFQRKAVDADGINTGAWVDVVTRQAKIVPKFAGETVTQQRIQGNQPATITVLRDSLTKSITHADRAIDAREPTRIWGIASMIWIEGENMMEFMAIERPGGSDE